MTMLLSPQILAVGNGILTPIETALANPSPGIIMEVDEIFQKTPTPNTKTLSIVSSNFFHLNCQAKWNISDQKTSNEDFHPNILRGRVLICHTIRLISSSVSSPCRPNSFPRSGGLYDEFLVGSLRTSPSTFQVRAKPSYL